MKHHRFFGGSNTQHIDLEASAVGGFFGSDIDLEASFLSPMLFSLLSLGKFLPLLTDDSVNKHGILLDVVQVISDMNLVIRKAYISSDGVWFMDVFNVIDRNGNKIKDKEVIDYIQRRLEKNPSFASSMRESVGVVPTEEHTVIELTGTDRSGLLSEICAVLADLRCNVVTVEIWTHDTRAAAVVHVTDDSSGCAIEDPSRLSTIKDLLCNVLRRDLLCNVLRRDLPSAEVVESLVKILVGRMLDAKENINGKLVASLCNSNLVMISCTSNLVSQP